MAVELVEPLLSLTLSPTIIAASERRKVIPATCDVTVDCRTLPGRRRGRRADHPQRAQSNGVDEGDTSSSSWSAGRDALVHGDAALAPIERWVAGIEPGAKLAPPAVQVSPISHWLRDAFGTVAYGSSRAAMDPELAARLIHSADERVHVDDLELGVEFLRELARSPLQ